MGRISLSRGDVSVLGYKAGHIKARKNIGTMLQSAEMPGTLKVFEHIKLFSSYYDQPMSLEETLEKSQLTAIKDKRFDQHNSSQFMTLLKKLHHRLLPDRPDIGYMPYIWLSYLLLFGFSFLIQPFDQRQLILSVVCVLVFIVLYFRIYWVPTRQVIYYILGVWLIGQILATENLFGAGVFYVYAGAFCVLLNKPKNSFLVLAILIVMNIVSGVILNISPYIYLTAFLRW